MTELNAPLSKRDRLKPWQAILATAAGSVVALVATTAVSIVAAIAFASRGGGLSALESALTAPPVVALGIATTSLTLLAVAFLTPLLARARPFEALGLRRVPAWPLVLGILATVALGPTSDLVARWAKDNLPTMEIGSLDVLANLVLSWPVWIVWPLLAVLPGVCEELFFRGMLMRGIGTGAVAIVVSGVAFAVFHMDPAHVAGVLPLGLYLSWLGARSGSTWVPIASHVANNTIAIVATRVSKIEGGLPTEDAAPIEWVVGGWVVAAIATAAIWWTTRPRAASSGARPEEAGA